MNSIDNLEVEVIESDLPIDFELGTDDVVGVDIETTGLDWESDKVKLVQIFLPKSKRVYLIHVGKSEPARITDLLSMQNVLKVFHHAMFDLRFLKASYDIDASNVWCTKAAWKIVSPMRNSFRLNELVGKAFSIDLPKPISVQQSDWGNELSQNQVSYAVGDVVHLPNLKQWLLIQASQREIGLLNEVMQFMPIMVKLEVGKIPSVFSY